MALTLKINSVDRTANLKNDGSLIVNSQLNARDTCSFTIIEKSKPFTASFIREGQEVTIDEGADRIFGGVINSIDSHVPFDGPPKLYYVQCVDYSRLCDRKIVTEVYENQTLGAIVADIISTYLSDDSFTGTNVQTGPTISKAVFNYVTVNDAFNELSELTGLSWYVDYTKDVHFFSRSTSVAPWSITDAAKNCQEIKTTTTLQNYRNTQFVRAGKDKTDTQTELFSGDSKRRVFTVAYPLAETPTIKVDTVSKTVGILNIDTGKQYYWNKDSKEIKQDTSETVLTTSNELSVEYIGFFPLILKADDASLIADRVSVEGGSGIYESVIDDQNIDLLDLAIEKSSALLRRYGQITKTAKIQTRKSGLKQGQLLTVNLTDEDINEEMLIESVAYIDTPNGYIYQVTALSGESVGGWVEFFKRLAKVGREYVIRENEVLTLLKKFNEQISLTDSITASDSAFTCAAIGTTDQIGFSEIC